LIEILEKEVLSFRKQVNYKVPLDHSIEHPRQAQKREQEKIDNAKPLTDDELGKILMFSEIFV
jgi:hypothetical protein